MQRNRVQLNIGCGMTPTAGWHNYDNSPSVRLAKKPRVVRLLKAVHALDETQENFIRFCSENNIGWADATHHIPHRDSSADTVYASHVFEHLDRQEAQQFLREMRRVLKPGGIIRIAVPNLAFHLENYRTSQDADRFMSETYMSVDRPRSLKQKAIFAFLGPRNHRWMYDGPSLVRTLEANGFRNAAIMPPGETRIPEAGALNLSERIPESVFVEAEK